MAERVSIRASEKPIGKVFSDEYAFIIPNYQRPYSWGKEQAGQLLDDLIFSAFQPDGAKPYFLGSIVLIKDERDPAAEVIDGQQRLVTLTILLSVLREILPDRRETLTRLIYERGDDIIGTKDRFRVSLRQRDQEFFEKYIQRDGQLASLPIHAVLSDSQTRIRDNAILFKNRLTEELAEVRKYTKLAQYIAQYCYLVVVETSDQESAYRIFSVLNDRGLPLSITDILKAEVLGAITALRQQEQYTKKWEDLEESLGREPFEQLFSHIRMVYVKAKARQSILAEIREHIKPTSSPIRFIDETLEPYAEAYYIVRNSNFEAKRNAEEINRLLRWLNQIDNDDWVAPAIVAVKKWGGSDVDRLLHFIQRLERLAFTLYAIRANINERIERYARVLSSLEADVDPRLKESGLGRKPSEIKQVIELLSGDLYYEKCVRYVLLRLDEYLAKGEASYNYPILTIEHVLPQSPEADSEWAKTFDEKERQELTNKLGNLVLLSRRKNSAVQNRDFVYKKTNYFGVNGVSPFALTTQVLEHSRWTPDVVRKRQAELIEHCKEIWKLTE